MQEGAGHAVISAYVEIVLDNSDGRIQVPYPASLRWIKARSSALAHECRDEGIEVSGSVWSATCKLAAGTNLHVKAERQA